MLPIRTTDIDIGKMYGYEICLWWFLVLPALYFRNYLVLCFGMFVESFQIINYIIEIKD